MAKTVNLQEIDKPAGTAAAVSVVLQGFHDGDNIELTFWEDDTQDSLIPSTQNKSVQEIGKIEGQVVALNVRPGFAPLFSLAPSKTTPVAKSKLKFIVAFAQPGAAPQDVTLFLPDEKVDVFEGESWEVFATVKDQPDTVSPTTHLARVRRALSVQKGEATYHHYIGNICRFYHDGSTTVAGAGGYFHDLKNFLKEATDFIFIADWSFHPYMRLEHTGAYDYNSTIGAALIAHAVLHPNMLIAIHAWDHTNIAAPDAQNDDGGAELDRIARANFGLKGRPKNLLWRKSSRTGIGFSHHQKFIVMDANHDTLPNLRRMRVFMGGLDLTKGRVDFAEHPILPSDPACAANVETLINPLDGGTVYDDWYNAEFFSLGAVVKPPVLPRQPWHDIAVQFVGPTTWDLVREFVGRWRDEPLGSIPHGDADDVSIKVVMDKYIELFTRLQNPTKPHNPFSNRRVYVQQWEAAGGPWSAQIIRSMVKEHWEAEPPVTINMPDRKRKEFQWTFNGNAESSIQNAYFTAIPQAERFIYIETQYFISSGSMWNRKTVDNVVAINLALRAIAQAKAGKPFHIYLVVPMFPEGSPADASNCAQRQFQWATIRAMAQMIEAQTGKKAEELMSVFFPARWNDLGGPLPNTGGDRQTNVRVNQRYLIYVHSKFMLIDDRYMIIGSANLNERSLNGARDSEIGVSLWPSDDSTIQTCIDEARAFRREIWAEHLGPKFPPPDIDDPSSPACIKAVRDAAMENYIAFREGRFDPSVHGHLCLWPLQTDPNKDPIRPVSKAPELDGMIPDRPFGMAGRDIDAWRWNAPGHWSKFGKDFTAPGDDIAE
jgi:phospholipase D1/2